MSNPDFVLLPDPLPAAALEFAGAIRGVLTLQVGSVWGDNDYGLDLLTRPFLGFTDEIYGLLPNYGDPDDFMPNMKLTNRQVTEGAGMQSIALLTYKGIRSGVLPPPSVEGGYSLTTTQVSTVAGYGTYSTAGVIALQLGSIVRRLGLEGANRQRLILFRKVIDDQILEGKTLEEIAQEESGEVNITYNSPSTTFMYVEKKEPKKPKFAGQLLATDGDYEIKDIQPASFKGRPICNHVVQTETFHKKKQGSFWECMEVNKGLITNIKVAMGGFELCNMPLIKRVGSRIASLR